MAPNDEQIDLLMRRYVRGHGPAPAEHLDVDEMNAFAEGALPPATRARYVSHLADCDPCRQQVSQLSLSSGAIVRAEQSVTVKPESRSIWQILTGMFALPALRYAAFAAVLLMVAGVAFIALRPRRENPDLVAGTQQAEQHPASALKAPVPETSESAQTNSANAASSPSSFATPLNPNPKRDQSKVAENTTPPIAAKDAPAPLSTTESKTGQPPNLKGVPTYAPPPPGETQVATQSQRGAGGVVTLQKKAEVLDKTAAADRERDAAREAGRADDQNLGYLKQPAPAPRRAADEKQKSGPSRNYDNLAINRSQNEVRSEPAKPQGETDTKANEESTETRSAGGRKFRRQGNSWVDKKFKSSMTLKSIPRGSDEFRALDSGLRSIAQQLGGEVIVVWKGQAYLIK
jgi:hypothetical protein